MAVIWGLDLSEMQWSKFGNSYMWKNTDYHRRRTKFIVYQIAMICCVVSESLGTAALSGMLYPHSPIYSRREIVPNTYRYLQTTSTSKISSQGWTRMSRCTTTT